MNCLLKCSLGPQRLLEESPFPTKFKYYWTILANQLFRGIFLPIFKKIGYK